jgi:hypothetical protein
MKQEATMPEINLLVDHATGTLLIETPERLPEVVLRDFAGFLGSGQSIGCARPRQMSLPSTESADVGELGPLVRVSGYYHNSLIECPGRPSCVLRRPG